MNLNGGYAMIKHDATQQDLAVAYKTKRPVLFYDEDKRAHWAQINEKVIETVDEETEEAITTYEYSYQLLNAIEALVDDNGNPRFIEGNGIPLEQEGVEISYCKWSLSGTHLMFVVAGNVDDTIVLANASILARYVIPTWILNKIYPVWVAGGVDALEIKQYRLTGTDWSVQNNNALLSKEQTSITIKNSGVLTLTANRGFRIQFDLLIDNE